MEAHARGRVREGGANSWKVGERAVSEREQRAWVGRSGASGAGEERGEGAGEGRGEGERSGRTSARPQASAGEAEQSPRYPPLFVGPLPPQAP